MSMRGVAVALGCVMMCPPGASAPADSRFEMDFERQHVVPLNGAWEALEGHAGEEIWKDDVAAGLAGWETVTIPGSLVPGVKPPEHRNVQLVWARRTFTLGPAEAARDAVLKWNSIRYGATVWINGSEIARHPVTGPHTVVLPKNVLREGPNRIVLKVPGWAGVPKSRSGYPLLPTGSGTQSWGRKDPGIMDHIWVEFYDRAYLKWVLAMPDLEKGKVTFRVWFDAAQPMPRDVRLTARVYPPAGGEPAGRATATRDPNHGPVEIAVPVSDVRAWTPRTPHLYTAELRAERSGRPFDTVRFRFGMRTVEVKDGHYRLNAQPLWLRGSNLVSEWLWSDRDNIFNRNIKAYIVDEAQAMNLNCFRTHTVPPPTSWLDVGDRHGTMFLAEFPVLYNYADFKFSAAEYETFHANALADATGWVTRMWNHPSVIIWVISNENRSDPAWEMGPYRDHVKKLDPTRPVLRSGEDTAETADMHICNNLESAEGQWVRQMIERGQKRDPRRTLSNTEYMNYLSSRQDISNRLLGAPDHPDEKLVFAEFAMEHTEVMRRWKYDLLLPYMYAGWTRLRTGSDWRPDYPTPMAAALHSCMSPVLASIDLYDRNFTAGRQVTTPLVLINETPRDVRTTLDAYITPGNPLFVPDQAALDAALWHESWEATFPAGILQPTDLNWKVPDREGSYFLAVVTRIPGGRPVVSQRLVRSVADARGWKKDRVVALGAPDDLLRFLGEHRIPYATSVRDGRVDGSVVVVGPASNVAAKDRSQAAAIRAFVRNGGRLVILSQDEWNWKDLLDFGTGKARAARAFPYPGAGHPLLAGIDPEFLKRWNGLPEIAGRVIQGGILERARRLLWMGKPDRPVVVTVAEGKGEIVICLLNFDRRLNRGESAYDPVAERMMRNLLER